MMERTTLSETGGGYVCRAGRALYEFFMCERCHEWAAYFVLAKSKASTLTTPGTFKNMMLCKCELSQFRGYDHVA